MRGGETTVKYQCDKGHIFIHPAKYTLSQTTTALAASIAENRTVTNTLEKQLCPFCESYVLSEFVEVEVDITSVKSVPLEEVDAWLAKGYKVRELYAKTATLIQTEAKP